MNIVDIADRAAGYDMPGVVVDGNDLAAVYRAAHEAVKYARAGGGPTLIECKTMRMRGHAIHDNMAYVPKELLAEWAHRDPITLLEDHMRGIGLLDNVGLSTLLSHIEAELDAAQAFAEQSPYPDEASLRDGVYA
jgi:pyruvate dehydrogenase E1 component alpha subunit